MNDKQEKWVMDPSHSEIAFKIRHLMITHVKGNFNDFEADIFTTGDDFTTAKVECRVKSASVDTRNADRDKHLVGPEFFDAENHPEMTFHATGYEKVDNDGSYELLGDLTIKDVTIPVKLDVEFGGVVKDPWGNEKAGFTINGKVNRKDWNLNWNAALEAGGVMLADDVMISCEIQLMRAV